MTNRQAAALRFRITVFQAELDACTTEAQRRCVKQAISETEYQLAVVEAASVRPDDSTFAPTDSWNLLQAVAP